MTLEEALEKAWRQLRSTIQIQKWALYHDCRKSTHRLSKEECIKIIFKKGE